MSSLTDYDRRQAALDLYVIVRAQKVDELNERIAAGARHRAKHEHGLPIGASIWVRDVGELLERHLDVLPEEAAECVAMLLLSPRLADNLVIIADLAAEIRQASPSRREGVAR
jgi:hypothetical protein